MIRSTYIRMVVPLLAIMLLGFYFCRKDNTAFRPMPTKAEHMGSSTDQLKEGRWRIVQFNVGGNSELSTIGRMEFTFNADGTVLAKDAFNRIRGTWTSALEDTGIFLSFVMVPLDKISGAWTIRESSATTFKLQRTEGDVTEQLTFERVIDIS
jgi:hypothetical protein